ncbi:MAG: hypothetical protein NXI15_15255 [Gammaproteobacteria bacterium]|jgi:lipid-binding SYLF domain-containing protein|nr:hypothetical protein [Gammaproteobacteria bacterium]
MKKITAILPALLAGVLGLQVSPLASGDDKEMIDANTQRALTWLRSTGPEAEKLLETAAGVLVFPDIVKMGFGAGGEFGEGALLVRGEAVDYYATAGQEHGMGPESEFKAEVIFFMTEQALENFRRTHSWKVGDHAQVPVALSGSEALRSLEEHIGLVLSEDGLVTHLQLEGDRITRIAR